MKTFHVSVATLLAIACLGTPLSGHAPAGSNVAALSVAPAAQPAAAIVDSFHAALSRGDTSSAAAMLAEDALIFEAGGVERGKAEYAFHHLAADAAFSKAVPTTRTRRSGHAIGSMAWIATEGRTSGTYNAKPVDRVTAETMVVQKVGRTWKIVHIHWSSAAPKKP